MCCKTHLSFLLVEIVNDDTDEEVEREEGAENYEDHKVQVHVEVDFSDWLFLHLKQKIHGYHSICVDSDVGQSHLLLLNPRLVALFPSIL